jgi:hypothetical protein
LISENLIAGKMGQLDLESGINTLDLYQERLRNILGGLLEYLFGFLSQNPFFVVVLSHFFTFIIGYYLKKKKDALENVQRVPSPRNSPPVSPASEDLSPVSSQVSQAL